MPEYIDDVLIKAHSYRQRHKLPLGQIYVTPVLSILPQNRGYRSAYSVEALNYICLLCAHWRN
jgi:hypothetical protein